MFSTDETAIDGLTLDVVCLMIEFFERIVRNIKEDENKTNIVEFRFKTRDWCRVPRHPLVFLGRMSFL